MRSYARPSFFSGMPQAGLITKWLCGLLVAVSIGAQLAERSGKFSSSLLLFNVESVLNLQLWRVFTYPLVKTEYLGLLISTVVLWLFGSYCETTWGGRDYLRFFATSSIGGAILAIPLHFLFNMILPFQDVGLAEGPDPAIDAMMVALALNAPNSNVLFGFVLPIPARMVIWLLLAMGVVSGLFNGHSTLSVTVGGMAMGYFLVTGNWRPKYIINRLRVWRLRRRRRDGLYVVPPRNKHTLN